MSSLHYLIAEHSKEEVIIALYEGKVKRLAHFIRYLEYMHAEEGFTFSLVNKTELKTFAKIIYVNNEEEFEEALQNLVGR